MEYDEIDESFEKFQCPNNFCLEHINGFVPTGKYKNIEIVFEGGFSEKAIYCWCFSQCEDIRRKIRSIKYHEGLLFITFIKDNHIQKEYSSNSDDYILLENLINALVFDNNNSPDGRNVLFKVSQYSLGASFDGVDGGYYNVNEQGAWCGDLWSIFVRYGISKYQEYFKSNAWKLRSTKFKEKNNGFCSLCNTWVGIENLETHHKQYPRDFKDDKEDNWIAICKVCHRKLHGVI